MSKLEIKFPQTVVNGDAKVDKIFSSPVHYDDLLMEN